MLQLALFLLWYPAPDLYFFCLFLRDHPPVPSGRQARVRATARLGGAVPGLRGRRPSRDANSLSRSCVPSLPAALGALLASKNNPRLASPARLQGSAVGMIVAGGPSNCANRFPEIAREPSPLPVLRPALSPTPVCSRPARRHEPSSASSRRMLVAAAGCDKPAQPVARAPLRVGHVLTGRFQY